MGRTPEATVRDHEERAWALHCRGRPVAEIAQALGITPRAVLKILDRIERRTLKSLEKAVGRMKARQTARLDVIYGEAMGAWERSLEDAETVKETLAPIGPPLEHDEEEDGGAAGPAERPPRRTGETTERTVKGQSGNPQHLAQARGALADQRAIWGMDAPVKVGLGGPAGGPVEVRVSAADRDEARRELEQWRKQMLEMLSSGPSAPPTAPTSSTPTG